VFSIAVWHLLENLEKASQQLASVLQNNGRFLIVLASRKHFDDWTAAYQSIENNDPQFIGKNNNGEVQDVIYLYSDSDLKEVLLKYNLEVSSIDRVRIWTVLEGFKKF
jgi:SAM-dependent methyltransferase